VKKQAFAILLAGAKVVPSTSKTNHLLCTDLATAASHFLSSSPLTFLN